MIERATPSNAAQLAAWRALWELLLRPREDEDEAVPKTASKERARDDVPVTRHPKP